MFRYTCSSLLCCYCCVHDDDDDDCVLCARACTFFQDDMLLKALRFLDTLLQRDHSQKVCDWAQQPGPCCPIAPGQVTLR